MDIAEDIKEQTEEFIENGWEPQQNEQGPVAELGSHSCEVLLQIIYCADTQIEKQWRNAGARRFLEKFSQGNITGATPEAITVEDGELRYTEGYEQKLPLERLVEGVGAAWKTVEMQHPDQVFPRQTYIEAISISAHTYGMWDGYEDAHERLNQTAADVGIQDPSGAIPGQLGVQIIVETLHVIEEAIADSVLSEREFVVHHLANVHTYEQIAEILEKTYGTEISRGAANTYKQRAERKVQSAIITIDHTTNGRSATADIEQMKSRPESFLTNAQKTDIAKYVREKTISDQRSRLKDKAWTLSEDAEFVISRNDMRFGLSIYEDVDSHTQIDIGANIHCDGGHPPENNLRTPSEYQGRPTRYSHISEAHLQTEADIREAFRRGFGGENLGYWRLLEGSTAFWDEKEEQLTASFISHIDTLSERTDPTQEPVFGHRYKLPDVFGDEGFSIIEKWEYDTFIQLDSGYGSDVPTTQLDRLEYAGEPEQLPARKPCAPKNHDFGETLLGGDESHLATCRACGYSLSALQHKPGMQGWTTKKQLDFECEICGEVTEGQDGRQRYQPEIEPKICNSCWNSEYFPHVDCEKSEFQEHVIVCWGTVPSEETYRSNTTECSWIAKPTEDTVTTFFADGEEKEDMSAMRAPGTNCPHCSESGEHSIRWVNLFEDSVGQALAKALAPSGDSIEDNSALFESGTERVLDDSEMERFSDEYLKQS